MIRIFRKQFADGGAHIVRRALRQHIARRNIAENRETVGRQCADICKRALDAGIVKLDAGSGVGWH